jgi:predicted TPR repeat methyltransferase
LERAHISRKEGKLKLAAEHYTKVLEQDPDHPEARYFLSVVTRGEDPDFIPLELVQDLFDSYAATYDAHVVETLRYQGPQLLRNAVTQVSDVSSPFGAVLDIGCGTGLCGMRFRDVATQLVGVDISPQMIGRARERGIYDDLLIGDVGPMLYDFRDRFDLVLAADVLGYFGDLRDVFIGCAGALRHGGRFAFTAEAAQDEARWMYLPGGRFAHGRGHIERRAVDSGFVTEHCGKGQLRQENGIPVLCHVVVLRLKPVT